MTLYKTGFLDNAYNDSVRKFSYEIPELGAETLLAVIEEAVRAIAARHYGFTEEPWEPPVQAVPRLPSLGRGPAGKMGRSP